MRLNICETLGWQSIFCELRPSYKCKCTPLRHFIILELFIAKKAEQILVISSTAMITLNWLLPDTLINQSFKTLQHGNKPCYSLLVTRSDVTDLPETILIQVTPDANQSCYLSLAEMTSVLKKLMTFVLIRLRNLLTEQVGGIPHFRDVLFESNFQHRLKLWPMLSNLRR